MWCRYTHIARSQENQGQVSVQNCNQPQHDDSRAEQLPPSTKKAQRLWPASLLPWPLLWTPWSF